MVALIRLQLSEWFGETSLREGRFPDELQPPMAEKTLRVRPSVAALKESSAGAAEGSPSSGGADNGRDVCSRLDFRYADTTERSTPLPGFTLFPVSTSVSSAPIRASTLRRNGGTRELLLCREWLLWWELEEGPGEEQVERKLAEPRLGRENMEVERWPLHWALRCSAQRSLSSPSSNAEVWAPWGPCWSLSWDAARWWWRRLRWEGFRATVGGAELADDVWEGSLWRLN